MISEQHDMKSGLDKHILGRLFGYAKKHYIAILISMVLLIAVVGVDLLRPLIVGYAIDDVITNYQKIYEEEGKATYQVLLYQEDGYYQVGGLSEGDAQVFAKEGSLDLSTMSASAMGIKKPAKALSVDEVKEIRHEDLGSLLKWVFLFIVLLLVGLVLTYYQTILLNYTGQKIIYEIRDHVFAHLQGLSVDFFGKNPVGKLVTRVTNDTETLNEMYTSVVVNSVKSILTLIGIAIMMLVLNYQLALLVFLVVPLIFLATWLFRKYSRQAYRDVRTRIAEVNTYLSEHISGMKIVQIFGRESFKRDQFGKINRSLYKANMREQNIFGIYRPTMYLIYVIGLSAVLLFGGGQVLRGDLSIGVMVVFLQYVGNFFDPIQQLAEQFNILQSAMASAEKIFTLLDEESMIHNKENTQSLEGVKGAIEFRNVSFAYNKGEYVLKDVSFKVAPGETVAFVGATGAGKTSILNLLSRYYEIDEGEILLDGINIKDLKKEDIRSHVGQMQQDVFLFTGDIMENIRLGDESLSFDKVQEAAKTVNAHPFIERLPNGYNEKVYERGGTYSAGQRQLISFARTLAYNPSVLILDEATANIDTETEGLIQDALIKMMAGRTTLVVAHRLSTIQHADKIVVLHKGRIKEVGDHQTLLKKKGFYYQLYQLQYQEAGPEGVI